MIVDPNGLARRMLADFDARTPGRMFAEPLELTAIDAYALQAEIAGLREQRGEPVIGYKVGCTSAAMQRQLGVGEPIFARVFGTGCFPSGVELSHRGFANLAVEAELAVRLDRDVTAQLAGRHELESAIESVFPVVELHHYVLSGARPSLAELVAGGGMHAGFVLPDPEISAPPLADIESLSLWIDGRRMGAAGGADLSSTVFQSLSWLARKLAEAGLTLARGQIVLTGSLLNLYPVGPGSTVVAAAAPAGRSSASVGP